MVPAIVAIVALVLGALGCSGEPTAPTGEAEKTLDELSLDDVPARVTGRIDGADFTVRHAFYRIERFPGRERVDLVLAERRDAECGLPVAREGRRVVVRFDDATELTVGTTTVERASGEASLLYDAPRERGYVGVGSGIALVAIDRVGRSSVRGRIDACFHDGQESCVRGAFRARLCTSRLDGQLAREGTGLAHGTPAPEAAP